GGRRLFCAGLSLLYEKNRAVKIKTVKVVIPIGRHARRAQATHHGRILGLALIIIDGLPLSGFGVDAVLAIAANPHHAVHLIVNRHDHRDARLVSFLEPWRRPRLEFLRLSIELREAALIHGPQPNSALFVEDQIQRADGSSWFCDRNLILDDLTALWVKHAQIV